MKSILMLAILFSAHFALADENCTYIYSKYTNTITGVKSDSPGMSAVGILKARDLKFSGESSDRAEFEISYLRRGQKESGSGRVYLTVTRLCDKKIVFRDKGFYPFGVAILQKVPTCETLRSAP